jgi:hypothetical protein
MQPSQIVWECSCKAGVGEVEYGKEREITELGSDDAIEGKVLQLHGSDAVPVPGAAGDADPVAEGHSGGPVAGKDDERVGELGFESQQRGKVSVAAAAVAIADDRDRR